MSSFAFGCRYREEVNQHNLNRHMSMEHDMVSKVTDCYSLTRQFPFVYTDACAVARHTQTRTNTPFDWASQTVKQRVRRLIGY